MSKPRLEVNPLLIQIIFRKIIFKGEIRFVGDVYVNFSILAIGRKKFIFIVLDAFQKIRIPLYFSIWNSDFLSVGPVAIVFIHYTHLFLLQNVHCFWSGQVCF